MRRVLITCLVAAASAAFSACALPKEQIRIQPGDFALVEFELRGCT